MTTPIKPTPKQAVIYNQDALYDFSQLGGSVESLFHEEIQASKQVVVIQEAINAPPEVVMIIESMDGFNRWKQERATMQERLKKLYGY